MHIHGAMGASKVLIHPPASLATPPRPFEQARPGARLARDEEDGIMSDLVDHKVQRVSRDGAEDDGADAAKQAARALVLDDVPQRPPNAGIGDGITGRERLCTQYVRRCFIG